MDNVQKAGLVVIPILVTVVVILIVVSIDWGAIAGPAINTATGRCNEWSDEIDEMQAEYNGRSESLGGQLDLDGSVAVMRNQLNLEIDRYNLECAGEETHYYEENL
jgi:hypothetical protein